MSVRFKRKTTWSASTSCWTAINCNLLSCSLEIPNSCEWSVSCAAPWWSGWEGAGPLWMSSWLRTIPAEVQIHNALHYFLAKKKNKTKLLWHSDIFSTFDILFYHFRKFPLKFLLCPPNSERQDQPEDQGEVPVPWRKHLERSHC